MQEDLPIPEARPSATRAFFSGFGSGLMSGVVMTGVIALLTWGSIGLAGAALTMAAPALFGGIMSVKHALFDAPEASTSPALMMVPSQVAQTPTLTPTVAPAVPPTVSLDAAAPEPERKSWVAQTGGAMDAPNRIQQILADGTLNDKTRAEAILASREPTGTPIAAR